MKIKIDYPEMDEEYKLVNTVTTGQVGDVFDIKKIQKKTEPKKIIELQKQASMLAVDEAVARYAVSIVRQTRDWQGISMGAGPRGGIALIRCARASALLQGRDFVTPDDVKKVALAVLRHRIILSPEMELEGMDADRVLNALLKKVAAPRQ